MSEILIYDPNGVVPAEGIVCSEQDEFFKNLRQDGYDIAIIAPSFDEKLSLRRFLRAISHKSPLLPIILLGAADEELRSYTDAIFEKVPSERILKREIEKILLRRKIMLETGLIGRSESLSAIADTILRIADTDITVLITGESGTGKELVARAIHNRSHRKEAPFVAINCGAIPETLLESQLFGHKKGAFTDAHRDFAGFFAQAKGGTLFLDEIGEVPASVQVKLLRVIETGEYFPVGSSVAQRADVRIVAATNRDPKELIARGTFRTDLYYRLSGVRIFIPPLRERREDIPILCAFFSQQMAEKQGIKFSGFSDDAIDEMMRYHWPGNVRELKNLVETAVILSGGATVHRADLIPYFREHSQLGRPLPAILSSENVLKIDDNLIKSILTMLRENNLMLQKILEKLDSPPSLEAAEKEAILNALKKHGGSRKKTAQELNISPRTLYRKMKKYGIN
ncbi:sigma-54-dependent Fis family transcriptional regulator [bacterium]|nr:sigma-54-dependent Fis family transcriptional regulator [bacterium]